VGFGVGVVVGVGVAFAALTTKHFEVADVPLDVMIAWAAIKWPAGTSGVMKALKRIWPLLPVVT
jgi:hypothetical protein